MGFLDLVTFHGAGAFLFWARSSMRILLHSKKGSPALKPENHWFTPSLYAISIICAIYSILYIYIVCMYIYIETERQRYTDKYIYIVYSRLYRGTLYI